MPPGVEPLKLFRTVAVNPAILERFRSTGAYLLNFGRVEPRDREVVIHRTCALCGCEYEWGVHAVAFGRPLGFTDEQLVATVHGDADDPAWSERNAPGGARRRAARNGHRLRRAVGALAAELGADEQLIELVAVAGFYHLVSFLANAAGVELEEAASAFPRVGFGRAPRALASSLVVVAVLGVLLAVNTIVTDRETKAAKADDRPHRRPARRRRPGARGRPPVGAADRAAALLRMLDALVGPGRRRALARDHRVDADRPARPRRLGEAARRLLDARAGRRVAAVLGRSACRRRWWWAIRWAARSRRRWPSSGPTLVRGVVIIDTRPTRTTAELPFVARLGFVPVHRRGDPTASPPTAWSRNGLEDAFAPGFDVPDQFVDDFHRMTYTVLRRVARRVATTSATSAPLDARLADARQAAARHLRGPRPDRGPRRRRRLQARQGRARS